MARKRKGMEQPIQVAEILGKSSRKLGFQDKGPLIEIEKNWNKIVGYEIAKNARPIKLSYKVLTIGVTHPSWMQELGFLKNKILESLNTHLNKNSVKDIRFEIVKIEQLKEKEIKKEIYHRELNSDEKDFINVAADQIKDKDIKEIVKRMMEKDFSSKK